LLKKNGITISGRDTNGLIDIIERKDHPFFIGTIFQPEFRSRPNKAHPLFVEFIKACLKNKN